MLVAVYRDVATSSMATSNSNTRIVDSALVNLPVIGTQFPPGGIDSINGERVRAPPSEIGGSPLGRHGSPLVSLESALDDIWHVPRRDGLRTTAVDPLRAGSLSSSRWERRAIVAALTACILPLTARRQSLLLVGFSPWSSR